MKFSELVGELRADIWPEGVPESLAGPIGKSFEAGVTHLQRYVPCLQNRNIDRYAQCATYFQGGKTVFPAPKGRIQRVYTILGKSGEEIYPALFKQVTKDELECDSLKHLSMIYPPLNLANEDLPMGFKYPEKDSDYMVDATGAKKTTKHYRSVIGRWAVEKEKLYVSPWINSDEIVVVEWDGVKNSFSSDDIITDNVDFKRALRLFVQRETARDFDADYERYRYMTIDFNEALGDLIHECKKENEVRKTFYCAEAYEVLAARRNKLYTEDKTAAAAAAVVVDAITSYTFGVIGDYGSSTGASGSDYDGTNASAVATLVKGWNPDFIITTGDNSYSPTGGDTGGVSNDIRYAKYDQNIGQWYSDYIFPYGDTNLDSYTSTATENKFFPSVGNHDITEDYGTTDAGLKTWRSYFSLPNNETNYVINKGHVDFFCVFSNKRTSSSAAYDSNLGVGNTSVMHEWLDTALANSTAHWKVVYFHHSPYTSESSHLNGDADMQWDFSNMGNNGADVVLSGHSHCYERLKDANGFPYLVCGASGTPMRAQGSTSGLATGITSEKYHGAPTGLEHGAIKGTVDNTTLTFEFITTSGTVIETYTLTKGTSDTTTTRTVT